MAFNTVYGPMSTGQGGPLVSRTVIGSTQSTLVGVTTSVLRANVPGINLRQTAVVNGVMVDAAAGTQNIDTQVRTLKLRK